MSSSAAIEWKRDEFMMSENGNAVMEYASLLTLILVITVTGVRFLGSRIADVFSNLTNRMNDLGL